MLKSRKGYLASEILEYRIKDRYSKNLGNISDLLINLQSSKIDYLIVGKKKRIIPISFVNNDDSTKKELILSQTKDKIKNSSFQKGSY